MLLTILVFFFTFSVLVLAHELGHFLTAKKTGIKVEEFGVGYPPRIWGKKFKGTLYSINWIPFGGFVRLHGEDKAEGTKANEAFWAKSKLVRSLVAWSGVLMNVVLAFFLFWLIFMISGVPVETEKTIINGVNIDSPADRAGIRPGDVVLELEGEKVVSTDSFIAAVEARKGEEISLLVLREEGQVEIKVVPRVESPEDEGPLGIVITSWELKHFPFWQMPLRAAIEGGKETVGWFGLIVEGLGKMVRDLVVAREAPKDIAGPLGILQVTHTVSRSGFLAVLQFIGILSINLAIINILPFPALDGGRFAFILLEAITGKKSPKQLERWVHSLGMVVILFLMILVTINDIKRALATTKIGMEIQELWPF